MLDVQKDQKMRSGENQKLSDDGFLRFSSSHLLLFLKIAIILLFIYAMSI